ncbi:MAG TPA: AIR synthase-related protein, partial [Arenibaculum sp.]|nr:AIR synthase-related protein [Arenibaculum sp.]
RLDEASAAFLADRYRRPRARTALAPALRRHASAGLDVSDGLVADLGHLCEVSGLAAVIESALLPLSDAARAALAADPLLADLPLIGGDDYELVVSVPPSAAAGFEADADAAGIAVSRIGTLMSGPAGGVTVLDPSGRPLVLAGRGWDHFRES